MLATGEIRDTSRIPGGFNFASMITNISGEEKNKFVCFIKRMITWNPEARGTARELLADPWLCNDFSRN
jgi:serine/threonine protein kinase